MFFWNSLAFSMIQWMLAISSLIPLSFLNPAWTSGSSKFMYCWSLAWRILSITLLAFWVYRIQFFGFALESSPATSSYGGGKIKQTQWFQKAWRHLHFISWTLKVHFHNLWVTWATVFLHFSWTQQTLCHHSPSAPCPKNQVKTL